MPIWMRWMSRLHCNKFLLQLLMLPCY
ncbi:hypothetical protein Godav_023087 [Gossypium davidsonii]|uniref:Uncharacterized protein n=2 Tax=Gossypium TaxID=3633 RepID=A0A7J8SR81_GOSDV|nr:hypothetical protein [Gossypium davidsonii]MBA0664052.1 hypothetical protein [Gossypium klotzschianum]